MRKSAGLLGIVLLLLLTGCWSRIEVTDLGVVIGMGVDEGENAPVRVTLFLARSPGSHQMGGEDQGQAGGPRWVVAREGNSMADALRNISLASSRRISLHHLRVVLIGEEYGRQGMEDLVDFLGRSPQIRLISRVMMVKGTAQEVLETEPQLEALQPENVAELLQAKGGPEPRLKELMVARASETSSGWIYAVHVIDRPARGPGSPARAVELSGVALLKKDKLVEFVDVPLAQGLFWLNGNPRDMVVTVPCPANPSGVISARVEQGKVRILPRLGSAQQLEFYVQVQGQVDVIDTECGKNVVDPASRASLEQQLSDAVAARARRVIDICQRTGTDPVGFGKWVQLRHTAFWRTISKTWPEVWTTVPVKVSTQIDIRHAGLLVEPANRTRMELQSER